MRSRARVARAAAVATLLAWAALTAAEPASAAGVTRYASVGGQISATCPISAPCDIETAINVAPSGSTVILEPGTYAPNQSLIAAAHVAVRGASGASHTLIVSSADATAVEVLDDSSLSGVAIDATVDVALEVDVTSTADHVVAENYGDDAVGCENLGTLQDVLCGVAGFGGVAIAEAAATAASTTLTDVTAAAPGIDGVGLELGESGDATMTVNVTNSILHGRVLDIDYQSSGNGESYVTTLSHSDASTFSPDGAEPAGNSVLTRDLTDITAAPTFADPDSQDFAEAAGSPTINKGESERSITTDVIGEPRKSGVAPDMGASEFQQKPTVTGLKVTKRRAHSAIASLKVNPESEATTVELFAVHGRTTVSSKVISAGHSSAAKTVRLTINDLTRLTGYTVYAVATNRVGSTRSGKKTLITTKH